MNVDQYSITVKQSYDFRTALQKIHNIFLELQYPVSLELPKSSTAALRCSVPVLGFAFYIEETPDTKNKGREGTLQISYAEQPALPGASQSDHKANMDNAQSTVISVVGDEFSIELLGQEKI